MSTFCVHRHCANITSASFNEMGLAYAVDPESEGGIYWTEVLASREQKRSGRSAEGR